MAAMGGMVEKEEAEAREQDTVMEVTEVAAGTAEQVAMEAAGAC